MIRTARLLLLAMTCALASADAGAQEDFRAHGFVVDQLTRVPISGALIVVDEAETIVVTDATGGFEISLPGPGVYRLRASAPHYKASDWRVVTLSAELPEIELSIEIAPQVYRVPTVQIYGSRIRPDPPLAPTKALIASDIRRAPGGFQDPLRALQESRAIESRNDLGTLLTIRGGEPDQILFLMDGFDIYNPYRMRIVLGGGLSLANPDIIESVELYAGGFSARYGNRASGLIHMRTRAGNRSAFRSRYTLSLVAASAAFEGPLNGGKGSWIVGLRRTYYDLFVHPPEGDGTQYPYLQEAQARLDWELSPGQTLILRASGSDEGIDLITRGEGTNEDVQTRGGSGTSTFSLEHVARPGASAQAHTRLAILADRSRIDLLGIKGESVFADAAMEALRLSSSHEWEINAPPHAVRFGLAWDRYWSDVDWKSDTDAAPSLNPTPESLRIDDHLTYRAAFLEDVVALDRRWFLSAGARFEDATGSSPLQVSPRFALRGELPRGLRFRVGSGLFLQYPDGAQSFSRETHLAIESLDELPPERATLLSLAVGKDWGRIGCDVEVYTRDTRDLLVPVDREIYTARATGRAYAKGLETELRLNPLPLNDHPRDWFDRLELDLSHAWSRSHFRGEVYDKWTPVATDREHSFLGRLRVPVAASMRFSCVLRLASGSPYTPLLARVAWWDETDQVHCRGVWGDPYSDRTSTYGRFDVRLDREIELFGRRGRLFLEVLNVTNRANTLSTYWDDDLRQRSPVRGLPLIPFIGLSM